MRTKNQRKTILVHPRMQARIILSTSLPMFACLIAATLAEFLYFHQVRQGVIISDGTIFGMPENRLGMLLLFVSASSVQIATALMASQKVAGTAYRIGKTLESFRHGKRGDRIRLRKADYQKELADDVNAFLDWVAAGDDAAPTRSAVDSPERARPADPRPASRDQVGTD
ncbi:hypothetical protein K8I85_10540 [bacterium]|nr:hypothetical protein [bacterium]